MSRPKRLPSVPFGWHYVELRSIARRRLITSRGDLDRLLRLLREILHRRGVRLHAIHVSECGVHLVLQLGEEALNSVTRRFQHDYARIFNREHGERGSLFRLHYRTFLFDHRQWLIPVVRYVHSLRFTERVDEGGPISWWSSDVVYRGDERRSLVTTNVLLHMLARGAYDRRRQVHEYRLLFDQPVPSGEALPFANMRKLDARILGDAEFVEATLKRFGQGAPRRTRDDGRSELATSVVISEIIDRFRSACDARLPPSRARDWRSVVTYDQVRSRSRRQPLPMLRALCASHLIQCRLTTAKEAAVLFGCGSTPVSARRRRFYAELFREAFGAPPEALLSPRISSEAGRVAGTRP